VNAIFRAVSKDWKQLSGPVDTKSYFVLWQGRKAFYEGSVFFSYSTGVKSLSDAARGQKSLCANRP
jgi:hypothetical protein